jgi:hypothetical protein
VFWYQLFDRTTARNSSSEQISVQPTNEVQPNFFGARGSALTDVGASAESCGIHRGNHVHHATFALWLTLRK